MRRVFPAVAVGVGLVLAGASGLAQRGAAPQRLPEPAGRGAQPSLRRHPNTRMQSFDLPPQSFALDWSDRLAAIALS